MSTSATIYNLTKREQFYLDHAYWLTADTAKLFTTDALFREVERSLAVNTDNERAQAWLKSLDEYVRSCPRCVWIVTYDTQSWDYDVPDWDTFRKVNNT